ncbi:alpha/beta fold hydrolase [Phenylobacterium terrae]|uniref:Alpha/beta fold hydrolase n=1 Tax=Phenylobacterium terrae TaxID=2665495 RepID=A0ABW4MXQ4_9CAUL
MAEPAPLLETPDNPAPPGGAAEWFAGAGGARMRAALFTPNGPPRGSVVLSGGRTEVVEKYYETIGELLDRGFVVLAHDWRGQGLSERLLPDRLKGHAAGFDDFVTDFDCLLAAYGQRLPKPWLAVGHSMGGCLTLLALAKGQAAKFAGAVLSAPMLALTTKPAPRLLVDLLLGRRVRLKRLEDYVGGPGDPFENDFAKNKLTHDPARYARNCALIKTHPDLALGPVTWGWLDFAFKATAYLQKPENLKGVTIPVTICQAGEEKVIDNRGQDIVVRGLPKGRLVRVPGAFHEILQETDERRAVFWREFDALADQVAARPLAAAGE